MKNIFISVVRILTFFYFLSISINSFSQESQINWSNWHSTGSFSSRDFIRKVVKSSSGTFYVTGDMEKDISNLDIVTLALSDSGNIIWNHDYSINEGYTSAEQAVDIYVDKEDNAYVVGYIYTGATRKIVAIKYNNQGKVLWKRILDDINYFTVNSIIADEHGFTYLQINENSIIKLNRNGKLLYEIDSQIERKIFELIYTEDNCIYVLGEILSENWARELIISKIDTLGNLIWQNEYPSNIWREIDNIVSVKFDSDQNLYVLSNIYTEYKRFSEYKDVMLQKINTDGALSWINAYGGKYKNLDESCDLQIIGDSSVYVGGHSINDSSLLDIFLLEYNSDGFLVDSFFYNSSYNESDYLFSFEIDSKRNKYLTTTSFINDYQFYSSFIKLDKNNGIEWEQTSPLSLSNRIYPEYCFLTNNEDKLFIFGNLRSTYNIELPYDINSDYWIMQLDTSGKVIDETVYGEKGTTNINDCFIKKDKQKNLYISAKEQIGPRYFGGYYYFNYNLIINKIDSLGNEVWSKKIENETSNIQDFYGHSIIEDSIIVLIGNVYSNSTSFTKFYKFNDKGELVSEVLHGNYSHSVNNAIIDKKGAIYTYEQLYNTDSTILRRFNTDFSLDWELNIKQEYASQFDGIMEFDNNNNLLFANGDGILFRISETGIKTQLGNFSFISDIKSDSSGNIFISGYTGSEKNVYIRKLDSDGAEMWYYVALELTNSKIVLLGNGDIAIMGATCDVVGCSPSCIYLLDSNGISKKSALFEISIDDAVTDSSDNIIINARNHLLKLSPSLDQISKLEYVNDTLLVSYSIKDFLIDENNNIYSTGGAGNTTELNTYLWNALLTIKFDNSNTNPYFISSETHFSVADSGKINFDYNALDYENDEIHYSGIALPDFLNIDSLSGILSGNAISQLPGDFIFDIIATDIHGGTARERVKLRIGNLAPVFTEVEDDSVEIESIYYFRPEAVDPEFDNTAYDLINEVSWLECNPKRGYLYGTPQIADTGIYQINLRITDEFGAYNILSYQLTVFIINNDPSNILLTNSVVNDGVQAGTYIGKLSAEDPDEDQYFIFTLVDGNGENDINNNKFLIKNDSLLINEDVDYLTQDRYNIYINVSDNKGGNYAKAFQITVDFNNATNFLKDNIVDIYPNPTNGIFEIDFSDIQVQKISIVDINGKVILEKIPVAQKEKIDLSNFNNGLYIIMFETKKEIYTYKIIKE